MIDKLKEDLDAMLEIMERTSYRCDIWQDRFIYNMAKAIYHILEYIIRKENSK